MGNKPRRMTEDDYRAAGVEPPEDVQDRALFDRIQGYRITASWFDELSNEPARCEHCGDENGACDCG